MIKENTEVEDDLKVNNKEWTWIDHSVRRADDRWTTKVTWWQPRIVDVKEDTGSDGRKAASEITENRGKSQVLVSVSGDKITTTKN